MRYRGFIIETSAEGDATCNIFAAEDKDRQFPLDEISLGIGMDIDELSDRDILPYAVEFIDKNILDLLQLREETRNKLLYAAESSTIRSVERRPLPQMGGENRCKYEYRHRRPSFRLQGGTARIQGVYGHSEARRQILERAS
ncbi:MAG: hypothetical protein KH365_07760 [Clostridiales bacterium]|nr:hypothetical protein [Clostridiales bacterium]